MKRKVDELEREDMHFRPEPQDWLGLFFLLVAFISLLAIFGGMK